MAPSSRRVSRRSRREPSEEPDEDEDEVMPPASSAEDQQEEEADQNVDEDGDDVATFDPSTFKDQPLDPKVASVKLEGFSKDWDGLGRKFGEAYNSMAAAAAIVQECMQGEDDSTVKELDKSMQSLIDAEVMLKIQQGVLDNLRKLIRSSPVNDAEHQYEKGVKTQVNEYLNQTARKKYGKSQPYTDFKAAIWEVDNEDVPMPPIKGLIPKDKDEESSDDDDIEIGGATQDFKCPITMQPFVDPLTSKLCKHSFSREALRDYFKQSGARAPCPASGCNKTVSMADFATDTQLNKRTQAALRRQKRRELDRDSDEDEMVVD